MTFTRFWLTATQAISKGAPTMRGCRSAVAVCIAGLLGVVPPAPVLAQTPLALDISVKIGPLDTRVNITKPVAQSVTTPTGGSAVVFRDAVHVHGQLTTPEPPTVIADLVATGEAADPDTLVGGILPAVIRVEQDLHAGMTFQQAAADAQAKTGVTVTFIEDPTAVEYAVMLALIIVVCITAMDNVNVARPRSTARRARFRASWWRA